VFLLKAVSAFVFWVREDQLDSLTDYYADILRDIPEEVASARRPLNSLSRRKRKYYDTSD
jgi:hypothetical protein